MAKQGNRSKAGRRLRTTPAAAAPPAAVPVPMPVVAAPAAARRRFRPGRTGLTALGLAAAIVALLLLANWNYLFHATLYEQSDWASNSLFVREAKGGVLLHGHYSRWDFYHPGPALFYVLAAGEAVFHDWLHAVPTPFNGQMISLGMALALFFSLALSVTAREVGWRTGGGRFFLPLALLFAVWHYAAAGGWVFLETWPVCPPILVFLALLAGAAAVGAGGGGELPLLAGAGGWLLHNYVAQPLFVLPLWLLAYGGLLWQSRRREKQAGTSGRGALGWLGAGWRGHRGAHLLAGALLLLFALPLVADALRGDRSNLHSILVHLQRHQQPLRKAARSLCYFLTFGAYSYYAPGETSFGRYSAAGMLAFALLHWRAYLCWVLALATPPALFAAARRAGAAAGAEEAPPPGLRRFVGWLYAVVAAACGLTLLWGMKQDGDMFYMNAYFNYSIYFVAALILAVALAVFLHALTAGPGRAGARTLLGAILWLGVAVSAADRAAFFQIHDSDDPLLRGSNRVIAAAAADSLPPGGVCFLDCDTSWVAGIAAALALERAGYRPRVDDHWHVMFGERRTVSHDPANLAGPLVRWRFVPPAADPASRYPLHIGLNIQVVPNAPLDPAGGHIAFCGGGNFADYALFGWWPTTIDWTWSHQHTALLQFKPLPLPEGSGGVVEMLVSAWAFTAPGHERPQPMLIEFNGAPLGTFTLPILAADTALVRVPIPAGAWQAAAARGDGRLVFRFPEAVSPKQLGLSEDTREFAGAFRSVDFRLAGRE